MRKKLLTLSLSLLLPFVAQAADFKPNYDESLVGNNALPSAAPKGTSLSKEYWEQTGRNNVLQAFRDNVYGQTFAFPKIQVMSTSKKHALPDVDGFWQTVELRLGKENVQLLLMLPNAKNTKNAKKTQKPVPVFLGFNFCGNHSVLQDPNLPISTKWANPQVCGHKVDPTSPTNVNNQFLPASRGIRAYRWPVHNIISQGFGIATLYYGDVLEDRPEAFAPFIKSYKPNESADDYSAIGVWSAALSSVADYLVTRPEIDKNRLIAFGHSRLGKTSLWAGANDARFKFIISNNSGEGGAALARRNYGETLASISTDFPHWFNKNYATFGARVNELPVDQHLLISLIAPRPVYVASAENDQWADPKGEFLAVHHAKEVYALYTQNLFSQSEQPKVEMPLHSVLSYHYRKGAHDVFEYDWQNYLKVAKEFLINP